MMLAEERDSISENYFCYTAIKGFGRKTKQAIQYLNVSPTVDEFSVLPSLALTQENIKDNTYERSASP